MTIMEQISRNVAYPLWNWKDQSGKLAEYRRLSASQHSPLDDVKCYQEQRLERLLRLALSTVPYYRDSIKYSLALPIDDPFVFLQSLPILTKDEVRLNLEHLISGSVNRQDLVTAKTGGSTGTALQLFFDEPCQELRNAAAMLSDSWAGWRPGMLTAALWGSPELPSTVKEKLRNLLHDRVMFLDTMRLDESTVRDFCALAVKKRPKVLFGHAHSIFELARFIRSGHLNIPRFEGIISTSMMLLEHERSLIEEVFDVAVFNRYGCEEVGLIAAECEIHQGLHINAEHVIVEFLGVDGMPVGPDEEARLILTDLNNSAMPLLRYEVGDMASYSEEPCRCGRTYPLMSNILGRTADYLIREDGSRLSGISMVEKTLTAIEGLQQLQIIQEAVNRFRLNAVAEEELHQGIEKRLCNIIRDVFGSSSNVTVNFGESLEQNRNGKYRFAVRSF